MGIFFAIWRRFFGGWDSKLDFLENRGVQAVLCIAAVFAWEMIKHQRTWYWSLAIAIWTYIFWCVGHWYWYKSGTESDEYIDEQLAKGRKPALNWLVAPINKWLGFEPRSKQACFVGMNIRYTLCAIPMIYMVGFQFYACAFAIPFIYSAMFWVELPNTKFCAGPTNWAEYFSGLIIGWALF